MKSVFGGLALVLVFILAPALARGEDVTVLTTTWIPYAYEEKGKIAGLGTEVVQAVLDEAGFEGQIRLQSWNRAIITAKTQKNILIYPLMRIREREEDFIWVCPIFDAKLSLFKLRKNGDIRVRDLAGARNYTIGVLKGAAMHQFLLSRGFEDNRQLQPFYSNRKSIELLFRERVDLVADNPLVVAYEIRHLARSGIQDIRFSMDQVEEILPLTQKAAYLAFGKGSSPGYVERLQKAWKQLEAKGVITKIASRYN